MAVVEAVIATDRAGMRKIRKDRNGLEVLDQATCVVLLGRARVGRIAYVASARARVVPVNIALREREVFFQVGTGGLLDAIADGQPLTLEADEFDAEAGSGWSIVVMGNAHEVVRRPDQSLPAVRSWLRPGAARLVRLTPQEISGRLLPPAVAWESATAGRQPYGPARREELRVVTHSGNDVTEGTI